MKKLNTKRVIIVSVIIIAIIVEIIALGISSANNVKKITAVVTDYSKLIKEENSIISATEDGDSGYYIILPESLNEKKISKYYIEQKEIQSTNTTNNAVTTENIDTNTTTQVTETTSIVEKTPRRKDILNKPRS